MNEKNDQDYDNIFMDPEEVQLKRPLLDFEESKVNNGENNKLSLINLLCFAVGGLPYQMCSNTIAFYITTYLLEISQLRPVQISIILFSARGWDAITDPLVGYLVNKTQTRYGKLRPWILLSTPFAIITYMMIWYNPSIDGTLKTIWYLVFYCLFQTFLSVILN
jgi:sodium-dependent lysophosphatidylcholine symporter 1